MLALGPTTEFSGRLLERRIAIHVLMGHIASDRMRDSMARHGLAFLHRSDLSGSCLSAYGSTRSRNRPACPEPVEGVRTRTPGGVGAGG